MSHPVPSARAIFAGMNGTTPIFNERIADYLYDSNNPYEIPNLLLEMQAGHVELPLAAFGSGKRYKDGTVTLHFYVDDYRFNSVWKNPAKIQTSTLRAIVEPNTSLFDTTPIAFGLHQIYKKRWIARFLQERGVYVYADLNVSSKFYDYNRMGIPDGYNAFATRGYSDRLKQLEDELRIAQEISGFDIPNMFVYGGGAKVQDFCCKHSLLYIYDYMTSKKKYGKEVR